MKLRKVLVIIMMQFVTVNEYLMNKVTLDQLPPELIGNVNTIVTRANDLLEHFGEYRKCNSGYRTMEDQIRINPKAPHSNHLKCLAIDLADSDGRLNKFCKDNIPLLVKIGLWCEERQGGWQHVQAISPASNKRFFNP